MDLSGSRVIAAPRDVVYQALLDRDVLKDCVPGCTEMSGTPEDGFEATVVQKVGPVKATFKGDVQVKDREPPEKITLEGEGKGGAAGFAKGGAKCVLSEVPEGTKLDYEVEAKVGGKLAQLGSRIVDGFAHKMADQFFERLQARIENGAEEAPAAEEEEAPAKRGWFGRKTAS